MFICWVSLLTKRLHRKELGYNPAPTLSLVRKWGPSTRNIIRSFECVRDQLRDPLCNGLPDPIEAEVRHAAEQLGADLWNTLGGKNSDFPRSTASAVVFIRQNVRDHDFGRSYRFIPTPHLVNIFEEYQLAQQNLDSLKLFTVLSSHSFTRNPAILADEQALDSTEKMHY